MIEVVSINKSFEKQSILKQISATFDNGHTHLIIGQSGAGKTVLLKCIVGLLTPDSGSILYDGRDISGMDKKETVLLRREMGMLFQNAALFDSMTVLQNVMFPLDMFSNMTYNERIKRARFCLDRVNMLDAEHKQPDELSGGMQKRAAIARAIALGPKYLFCDEPNSGLDPYTSILIDRLISDLTKEFNMTTVVNTHDMNSILEIGDKIGFIHEGELLWQGDKKKILQPDCQELKDFVCANTLARNIIDGI